MEYPEGRPFVAEISVPRFNQLNRKVWLKRKCSLHSNGAVMGGEGGVIMLGAK